MDIAIVGTGVYCRRRNIYRRKQEIDIMNDHLKGRDSAPSSTFSRTPRRWLYLLAGVVIGTSLMGIRANIQKALPESVSMTPQPGRDFGRAVYRWTGYHRVAPGETF